MLRRVAARKGATPAQLALAWLLAQKPWIIPIPGTTKLHRIEENIGAANVELTGEDLDEINTGSSQLSVTGERKNAITLFQIVTKADFWVGIGKALRLCRSPNFAIGDRRNRLQSKNSKQS